MDYRKTLADRLRVALLRDGRMATALCRDAGITPHTLRDYLAGKYMPKVDTASRLAAALGVSLDWLMGRDSQKKSAATLDSAEP